MRRFPVLGAVMEILGVISLLSEYAQCWFLGKPILHWASLLNVLIAASLVAAGALLFRGRRRALAAAILTWSAIVVVAVLESLLLWRNAQGIHAPWTHVASNIIYVVVGGYILRFLFQEGRTDV